jgi:hypothetical protein
MLAKWISHVERVPFKTKDKIKRGYNQKRGLNGMKGGFF